MAKKKRLEDINAERPKDWLTIDFKGQYDDNHADKSVILD